MTAPTSFGLAFFLRVALPGIAGLVLLIPLLPTSLPLGVTGDGLTVSLGLAAVAGILLSLLDTPIYRIFEGRLLWPGPVRDWGTRRQAAIIRNLKKREVELEQERTTEQEKQPQDNDKLRWIERELGLVADKLLDFPWFEYGGRGEPGAQWPTRFGNVLAAWEYYPETRYGMDSSFYWYRLWLVADDNDRKELDTYWAFAQAWVYIAALSILSLVVYGLLAIWFFTAGYNMEFANVAHGPTWLAVVVRYLLNVTRTGRYFPTDLPLIDLGGRSVALTIGCAVLFLVAYHVATVQHRVSGEFYKALFDLNRDKLIAVPDSTEDREAWREAANKLQYLRGTRLLRRMWPPPR